MKHLVIIGLVLPEPKSTAAGMRMLQLMQIFQEKKIKITFLTTAKNEEFSEKLSYQKIELNDSNFDETIRKLNPDFVLFDRFITEEQFGWRVSETCPNAIKILDTEDLHFLRETRRKAFFSGKKIEKQDFINDIFKRELASILRCDLSLIISEFEYKLLTEKFKISPKILFYIPFITEKKIENTLNFQQRNHFVSIGNFLHEPNWHTVLRLKSLWKGIRKKIPNAELHIFGAYASEKVFQLNNENEGFIVKGRAECSEDIFRSYKVLLAPIPFGAGLKGKLFESMLFGLPSITTTIGAEGMHQNLLWNGFIEDEDNRFIEKSVQLYSDEKIWNIAHHTGFKILENKFHKKLFVPDFFQILDKIKQQLKSHRTDGFLGQILQYHQLQSTKYLSKWIEEKNKKSNTKNLRN